MRFQFCKTILLLAAALVLVLAYPVHAWAGAEIVRAVVASGIIALANIIIGCITLDLAIDKRNTVFMAAVFGGMGIRMGLILVAMTILLLNGYHALALSLSLMGFYIVFMIAEIVYAARELGRRNAKARTVRRDIDNRMTLRSLSVEVDHRSN